MTNLVNCLENFQIYVGTYRKYNEGSIFGKWLKLSDYSDFEELQKGLQRVGSFIFSESYHIEKAIAHASKAAYISTLIQHNAKTIDKFENPLQLKDWKIGEPLNNKLNKLKKSNPEAFFYWYKIYELNQ